MTKHNLFFKGLAIISLCMSINAHAETNTNEDEAVRFSKTIAYIKQYAAQDVNDQRLLESAMDGMLKNLDAHSSYLDKDGYKALNESTDGQFAGVGLELAIEQGVIRVVTPLDDSPAAKTGIKAGDYIVEINQKPVRDMSLNDAVNMMKGPASSTVALTIVRKGENKPLTFNLTRQVIQVFSVKSELLPDGYGYARISQFQENTAKDVKKAVVELQQLNHAPLKGLILDLRNNPGGLLTSAIHISDLFLDNEKTSQFNNVIVSTKGRHDSSNMEAKAADGDILLGAPIIVLINGGSASASEIVAGALQDYKRAVIIGQQSFGKGSVQTILPLDETHAIKLTTALYYTPSGRSIQAQGIKPDIIVEDLKLEKAETVILQPLKESDLKGHIENASAVKNTSSKTDDSVANKDYQVSQALLVLKALHIANGNMMRNMQQQ